MTRWHWLALGILTVGSLVAERLVHHEHEYWFTGIPGFFVVFGFVGCVAIIFLSKWYGKHGVQRPETYYDEHGDADPHRIRTGVGDPSLDGGDDPDGGWGPGGEPR